MILNPMMTYVSYVQSIKYTHQYLSFFGKELSISRFQSWDWSQMKALVILHSLGGINEFLNPSITENIKGF